MHPMHLISAGFRRFCTATVLTQAVGLGYLGATGRLEASRVKLALAMVYGRANVVADPAPENSSLVEHPSFDEVAASRWRMTLDVDLRETSLEKALVEYDRQTAESGRDRARYDRVKNDFDRTRASQLGLASNPQLQEVRRTLEAIKPAQAKEELLNMLADGSQREVVALLKSMPLNRRKKIVAEFKAAREADQLEAVFNEIRLGQPEVDLIRQTRAELQTLGSRAAR